METDVLELPAAIRRAALRHQLLFTRYYENVCSAGSLAVILQPAFVHC
jgi:hypothetical protein